MEYSPSFVNTKKELLNYMPDTKMSNPKDVLGCTKIPLDCVPDTISVEAALAFHEGSCHYGKFNYRAVGVRASVYRAAMQRHMIAWWNGEDEDPETGVKHLASIIACCGIILDADLMGRLTDDRPPANPALIKRMRAMPMDVLHLQELFKDDSPHHYTEAEEV